MSNCHLVAGRSLIDLERCVNEMNWCHVGQQAWVNELKFRNLTACRRIDLPVGACELLQMCVVGTPNSIAIGGEGDILRRSMLCRAFAPVCVRALLGHWR
jgi:hypothetical protein